MHLCLTVECITSGLHLSVFELGHHPPLSRPAPSPAPCNPPPSGCRHFLHKKTTPINEVACLGPHIHLHRPFPRCKLQQKCSIISRIESILHPEAHERCKAPLPTSSASHRQALVSFRTAPPTPFQSSKVVNIWYMPPPPPQVC